jgi:hypothetical protein
VVTLQTVVRDAIAAPRFPYSATKQLPYRTKAPLLRLKYRGCDIALLDQGCPRVIDEYGAMVE